MYARTTQFETRLGVAAATRWAPRGISDPGTEDGRQYW